MEGTGRQQDFKHGQSKRTVLNLEQGEDVFLYLHEILKTIHAGVGGGTGMRLETWYETIAVG